MALVRIGKGAIYSKHKNINASPKRRFFSSFKQHGSLQHYLLRWTPIHSVDESIFALSGEDYDPLLGAWL